MTKQEQIAQYRTMVHIAVKDGRRKDADRYAKKVLELKAPPVLPIEKEVGQ